MAGELSIIVVTPEKTAINEKTSFVALPLHDGEKGVAANHAPMIGKLGFGELRFDRDGQRVRLFVDGGFVQIANNEVSVITERAIPADQLQRDVVEQHLHTAMKKRAHSADALAAREHAVARSRAQLRLADKG